ncbi:MAG: amidase [Acidobacteria bacterium]|nr:amidase [Acidobacteriota bacterium]
MINRREALVLSAAAANAAAAPELCFLSAIELARRIRSKQLSSREALEAHLRQIERINPKVNAIVTLVAEQAMARARQADEAAAKGRFFGPLHGLPIAHKDLQETKGIRTTYGSPIFKDYVPEHNTLLIERIQNAGAVTIGKTNTPEFGAGSQTFNPVFGATRNPYDVSKTCGGSSGGAAVALACGMIPIADGSDTGGSLRNPASFCSVVGFRTSPGRVPRVPTGSAWNTISVLGPMARNVADAALLLSVIAGPDPRTPLSIQEPGSLFARPLDRDCKGVRIAWCSNFAGLPFDRRVREVFQSRRKTFESMGCLVEEADPDFSDADEIFKVLRALSFHQQHAARLEQHRSQIKAAVIEEIERGARLTGPQIVDAEVKRSRLYARFGEFLTRYEFLVLPVTQAPPFDINQPYLTEIEGVRLASYIDWMRSCYYITVTGHPAISVPGGFTSGGLPVGIQIVGRHHDDWGVLQLADAFEQARGPLPRPPLAT